MARSDVEDTSGVDTAMEPGLDNFRVMKIRTFRKIDRKSNHVVVAIEERGQH
jgi:hypothetical protein